MTVHRPIWFLTVTLLVVSCLLDPSWADDQSGSKQSPTGTTKSSPDQAAPPDLDALRGVSGKLPYSAIQAFGVSHNIPITEVGTGQVRLVLVGAVPLPNPDALIKLGTQTLTTLELWSGQQGIFLVKHPSDDEIMRVCVFKDNADFLAYCDTYLRGKEQEFTKKCLSFTTTRMTAIVNEQFNPLKENYTVFSFSGMAIKAYYNSKGKEPPTWIVEGAGSQLQRIFCQKLVRCSSFSYEYPSAEATADYAKDVANMIRKKDPTLIPALSVFRKTLDALPGSHYRQCWSLFALFQEGFDHKPGLKNKFYRLLDSTLKGTDSETAVKTIFKMTDPALTKAWRDWAVGYQ